MTDRRKRHAGVLLLILILAFSGAYAQAGAELTENYMAATINGEEKVLTLESYELIDDNTLLLHYTCRNPLGRTEWMVSVTATLGDAAGTVYQTEIRNVVVAAIYSDSRITATQYNPELSYGLGGTKSTYELTVQSRSEDWRTYTGTFWADLKTKSGWFRSAQETVTITDGYFCFTYTGD